MIEILSSSIKSHPSTPRVALIGFSNEIELQLRDAFAFEFGLVASSFDSQESLNISDEYPSGTIKFACVCDEVTILDFRKDLRLEFAVVCKNFITAKAAAWIEKGAAAVYSLEHHSAPEIAQLVAAHLRVVAQSKSRLPKSTQEHSSNAQIEWTKDLEIVRWSEGAEQILGFAARHVAGRSLGEWLFPAGKMRDFLSKASSLDESSIGKFSACCRTRCFDGSFLKTNWRLAPVANEFGSVTSILGICEPLTGATEESSRAEDLNSLTISEDQDAGLWDHDIENGRLFWSPNLFKRFGLGFYETTPSFRSYLGRIPKDDRRRLWRSYLDCIQGKANSFTLIYRMKNTGDQWRYYHAKVEVKQRSSKGRVSRVVGSDIDVTRYINATEELRFAKHTVDSSSSGILLANARGQIIYHNEAVNRMLGYTSDELGEISIGEVDPHLVPPTHLNKKAQFPLSGPWEKVYRSKDGKNIDVEVDCKFIDAANETVLAVYIRNISRRKRIEREVTELNKRLEERVEERTQQLAESNEKLRNEMRERLAAEQHASQQRAFLDHVVEKLPLGIYVTEAEKNCRISVWNAEMERLFGNSKDTVVGKRIDEIFADPHLAKVLGDQRKQDVHSRTIAPPSNSKGNSIQSFVADIARTPIFDAKGKRVGLVGVLQDVSERIDSENRLVAAFRELELSKSKLEQSNLEIRQGIEKAKKLAIAAQDSNRAKSFFMSNISHELRTPLNSILGLTSVLLEKTFGDLTYKQGEFLQIIDDSSRHLQSLITDILDLSKIELGKLKLQYSPISPKELGDTTLKMVKQAKDQKPLEYQLKCPSRIPEIEADPRRLRQILLNLLGNAAKFAAEDTTITLSIKVAEDGERITFSVKDRGIGIRNADLRKLFKPFVQIDDSLSRSHEGTGLGLAIVHKLVELHGGSVYVESQPHKGSVFSFSIPTRRTTQDIDNQLKLSDVYDAAPHRQVALVIDENEASAQHACRILKKNGYAHPVVTYPNEVSAHYEHLSPHLLLIDIQTLRNQGSDWIAVARNHPNWEKTAWLATSSLNTQPDLSYCEQLGLHIFTPKPLTPNNLRILNP